MRAVEEIVSDLQRRFSALDCPHVRVWKEGSSERRAIGCLPVFAPREVIWASGALPVFVRGAGEKLETIRGDSYYQSYICHLPRSTLELGLGGWLSCLDGMVFPNTCDVIRNLSGIWRTLFPAQPVVFLDPPQGYGDAAIRWWRGELLRLYSNLCKLTGRGQSDEALRAAFVDYRRARAATRVLGLARNEAPWKIPADEAVLVRRAGDAMPPLEYVALVDEYVGAAKLRTARKEDRTRVVLAGAFCEQPPLGLLRAVERAGCYVVADDLVLVSEDLEADVAIDEDPLGAIAWAFVRQSVHASVKYDEHGRAGDRLVEKVRALGADGVVLAAPSFCDPALLEQPRLTQALDRERIPYTVFKYAENTGQFQAIREQAGTFADSIRLWGEA